MHRSIPALLGATALAGTVCTSTPRSACCTLPLAISWSAIDLTVLDGIAKPIPSLPPELLSICAVTPMTSPWRLKSGPPELPWLIAASV